MRSQSQQREAPTRSTNEAEARAVARGRRRTGSLAITAAVACGALLILVIVSSSRGGSPFGPRLILYGRLDGCVERRHRGFDSAPGCRAMGRRAGGRSDDSVRHHVSPGSAEPKDGQGRHGRVVRFNSSGSAIRLRKALSWVDGLAAGLIIPSDITSRLEAQDPRMAKVVMDTWSDLNAVATSD